MHNAANKRQRNDKARHKMHKAATGVSVRLPTIQQTTTKANKMSAYIIPEGWTPIATPWRGSQRTNVLLSNGEMISDRSEWQSWERYQQKPFKGMDGSDAYPVAWQLIEPLKERPRPVHYVDLVPDYVELKNLRAIRRIADDSIVAFIWEGKAANLLRDVFDILINDKGNDNTSAKVDQ